LKKAYEEFGELALTFGASELKALEVALRESWEEALGSVAMVFSRAVGELGVALIVGGNIAGYTRTMSTAIALYTQMGEFEKATELGVILATLSVGVSFAVKTVLKRR
jgi:tungstate transport system permease protein